jgi:glycerol-3-phosphate acyltransferase PlsY
MSPLTNSAILLACYALGCLLPSYYAVKWQTGSDLRETGSGTAGATNAGRVLGRSAFVVLAMLDILKGWLAVQMAWLWGATWLWLAGAGVAVVAGHIWPGQLRFRGGKGLAPAYGVILYWSPWTALLMWAVLGLGILAMRNKTLGMLQAFFSAPLIAHAFGGGPVTIGLFIILAILMAFTHRRNIREAFQRHRVPAPTDTPAA